MCPQWLAVVGTNHHSDKMTTTTNSLTSTKYQHEWKYLYSLASHFTQNKVSTRNPRHSLSIDIKFRRFKTPVSNHHSPKPGHTLHMYKLLGFTQLIDSGPIDLRLPVVYVVPSRKCCVNVCSYIALVHIIWYSYCRYRVNDTQEAVYGIVVYKCCVETIHVMMLEIWILTKEG